MGTETIKSKRRLSQSMGDLYILEHIEEILKRMDISRGYIIAISYEENLYSHTFAQCEDPNKIGKLDKIVVEEFGKSDMDVVIPFDVCNTRGMNTSALENYLNLYFRNRLQILKTENDLTLFQRDSEGNLIASKSSLISPKESLPYEIRLSILMSLPVINILINEYIVITPD